MKKLSVSGLVFCLILALTASLFPINVSAATTLANGPAFSELQLSHYQPRSFRFAIEGSALRLSNLPVTEEYNNIWLSVIDMEGNRALGKFMTGDGNGGAYLDLRDLPAGHYYLVLSHSARRDSYETDVYKKQIHLFWQNGTGEFLMSDAYEQNLQIYTAKGTDTATLAEFLRPSSYIESDAPAIKALAAQITTGVTDDYEKTLRIHNWVCENIWYDYDVNQQRVRVSPSALVTLERGRGVCSGYAYLTAALLRASGIPAQYVSGKTLQNTGWPDGTNHAWTEAFVNGRWLEIDTTLDSGNKYEFGQKTASTGLVGHRYFDSTWEVFSSSHALVGSGNGS
jgi:transglutaminase-like putative cysteine protease